MARYDDSFVDRFLEPWNRHDVDGALALMTDDCVWEIPRGREPHDAQHRTSASHARVDLAVIGAERCPRLLRTFFSRGRA
jgi:ketosteroid isomerase-like protein